MEKPQRSTKQRIADFVSSLVGVGLLIVIGTLVILAVIQFLASAWVGSWKPILDPQLIVSLWVAELPLAYFVNRILGERVDRPVLEIIGFSPRPTVNELDPTYYESTVWNKGELMAEDCDVRVNLDDLGEFELSWQPPREAQVDIKPDRKQTSEVFRIMPLEHNIELPIAKDWRQSKKLGFGNYTGMMSIGARNCRPAKHTFRLTFDKKLDKMTFQLT